MLDAIPDPDVRRRARSTVLAGRSDRAARRLLAGLARSLALGDAPPVVAEEDAAPAVVLEGVRDLPRERTGDLDGMIERRAIRVLVTYSETYCFVDQGTQRGIVHDAVRAFESELNERLGKKTMRVPAVFGPVRRDQLIPGLLAGLGDLAIANLTIAAYDADPARVRGLRAGAIELGLDPNAWLRNVEAVAATRIARETVQYVSNVYEYHIADQLLAAAHDREEAAHEGMH